MIDYKERSAVKDALISHAPTLSSKGLEILSNMHHSEYLSGTEEKDPILIDPAVRIAMKQGAELHRIVRDNRVKRSLEIGFAYGFSTVWMLDGLSATPSASHMAVDPFERSDWHGIGLFQVEELDPQARFEWIEDYSFNVIPRLMKNNEKFDFIFIDGNHRFDDIMVDFYLCDMVLAPGGMMAFDDLWMKSVRAAVRFITKNRQYELVHQPVQNMAVFRKIADDSRPWNHFRSFRTKERLHETAARLARSKRVRNKISQVLWTNSH